MYADVTTESDLINKMGNKALAWQINLYGLSSLWAMNRGRMCVCCLGFLIKPQKHFNTFDKQDEHEPVIRACDPRLLHTHCTAAIILISVDEDWTFLLKNCFLYLLLYKVVLLFLVSILIRCQVMQKTLITQTTSPAFAWHTSECSLLS